MAIDESYAADAVELLREIADRLKEQTKLQEQVITLLDEANGKLDAIAGGNGNYRP